MKASDDEETAIEKKEPKDLESIRQDSPTGRELVKEKWRE
jgi:hypothetical protein